MADVEINLESTDSKELLKSGHHAFITKDYANAAAALGKATQIMAQEHGDEHDSLGEVYLHYARALLELSRDETEPLGDAIPQGGEEDSDDEEGEGEGEEGEENGEADGDDQEKYENEENEKQDGDKKEEGEEKQAESKTEDKKEEPTTEEAKPEETEEKKDEPEASADKMDTEELKNIDKEELKNIDKEEQLTNGHAEPGPSTSNSTTEENAEPTEEPAEPSDLQIAWEVLEVAKRIFTVRGDDGKELLSQTHILLGEVGMESENFNDAVTDIKAGLELQESLYEKTNRKLAESYYKLGMAQGTIANFDDAVKCFEKSIEILKSRIELLKEKDDESSQKEIKEMEELLPEIQEKINDMNTVKEETAKVKAEMAEACGIKLDKKENVESSPTSATKEVKDISHLVKRKRKIEEESPEGSQPAKKPTP